MPGNRGNSNFCFLCDSVFDHEAAADDGQDAERNAGYKMERLSRLEYRWVFRLRFFNKTDNEINSQGLYQ